MGAINLSRSLGDFGFKRNKKLPPEQQCITAEPDVFRLKLIKEYDFMVIACDGIWDVLSPQQCVDFVY